MYLKKFIYVNWGNIPQLEFEFGPICLFSGGNGSGKTTAADAIQTVMTAAHDNLFHFNPGQDESSQRGRGKQVRTLASYVLGCDDGSYARPHDCDGYLAAIFHPTDGEDAEPFTAIIGMRAHLDDAAKPKLARLDDCHFYILPGEMLSLSHFVREDVAGRYVTPLKSIYGLLKKEFGAESVEKYDKKKAYLCRLYGAVRGKREAVSEREAMNAARAFSRFMAYKPVKSINDFVAGEILEGRDLGEAIRNVSSLLKTIHGMESEARSLRESIAMLASADQQAVRYIEQWLDFNVLSYTEARCRFLHEQRRYVDSKREQQNLREAIAANIREREVAEQRRRELRDQGRLLEAQRMGIPALRDKDQLQISVRQCHDRLHNLARPLLEQDHLLQQNIAAAEGVLRVIKQTSLTLVIPSLSDKALRKIADSVVALKNKLQVDLHGLLGRDWVDISPLEAHLDDAMAVQRAHNQWAELLHSKDLHVAGSLREQLAKEKSRREQDIQGLKRNAERKRQEIDGLQGRQSSYPHYVRSALDAIRKQCPDADARVLCDYVEVLDSAWQSAIEGYIGGARFGIIVESEYEAEAIRLVRSLPGRDNRARVIQGETARRDAERSSLSKNSIVNAMEFHHETARNYLTASYGNVDQVCDVESLRHARRGITRDCMGSGNYALFRCDLPDSELVFGQGARERALEAKSAELIAIEREWQGAEQQALEVAELLRQIDAAVPLQLSDILQEMLSIHRELRSAESSLSHVDVSDFSVMDDEINQLREQEEQQDSLLSTILKQSGELETKLRQRDRLCNELSEVQEGVSSEVDAAERSLKTIAGDWSDFNLEKRLELADIEAAESNIQLLFNQREALLGEMNNRAHALVRLVLSHNQQCRPADVLSFDPDFSREHNAVFFKDICSVQRQLDQIHNRLKNNILAVKHEKLEELKLSFNNTFVTNLCHSIYQAINDGKKILEDLNDELQHHRFGADRESFRFDWEWLPEYKEYWQFFKEVIDNPSLGDGATLFDMKLSKRGSDVRDHLMSMLLEDDENKALRELDRIADYRNYRNYEIYKEPEGKEPIALSQYGTGSGGQLETPAYIIRSAAITSAFRFNEGKSHLRMVLVDEAFSKMDEHRSKEVINYLSQSLGLQLLFIMPTSKSGPFMDLISNQFVFTKCPIAGKVGELNTRVLVDRQACNSERIQELWASHRRTIRHQAALDFMVDFAEPVTADV